jgi:hypothetical protein
MGFLKLGRKHLFVTNPEGQVRDEEKKEKDEEKQEEIEGKRVSRSLLKARIPALDMSRS